MTTSEFHAQLNTPFFISRCREALPFYSALFHCLATFSSAPVQPGGLQQGNVPPLAAHPVAEVARQTLENLWLGVQVVEVFALEGMLRKFRPERADGWRERFQNAGFEVMPMPDEVLQAARNSLQAAFDHRFSIVSHRGGAVLYWGDRSLMWAGNWQPRRDP